MCHGFIKLLSNSSNNLKTRPNVSSMSSAADEDMGDRPPDIVVISNIEPQQNFKLARKHN